MAYAVHSVYVLALGPPDVEIVNGYINLSGSLPSELLVSSRSRATHTRHHSISSVLQDYRVSSRAVLLQLRHVGNQGVLANISFLSAVKTYS